MTTKSTDFYSVLYSQCGLVLGSSDLKKWSRCCGCPMSMLGFYKVDPILSLFSFLQLITVAPSKGIGWSDIPSV